MLHVIVEGMRKPTEKKHGSSGSVHSLRTLVDTLPADGEALVLGGLGLVVLALSIQQVARGVPIVRRRYVLEAAISQVTLSGAVPPAARCGATVCGT